jgi:predicted RNA-binding protein Jag
VARGTKLLAAGLQLAFAGMPLALGAEAAKAVEDQVKFVEELTKHLELEMPPEQHEDGSRQVLEGGIGKDLRVLGETGLTRIALAMLLEKIAPNNYRGFVKITV